MIFLLKCILADQYFLFLLFSAFSLSVFHYLLQRVCSCKCVQKKIKNRNVCVQITWKPKYCYCFYIYTLLMFFCVFFSFSLSLSLSLSLLLFLFTCALLFFTCSSLWIMGIFLYRSFPTLCENHFINFMCVLNKCFRLQKKKSIHFKAIFIVTIQGGWKWLTNSPLSPLTISTLT